MSIYIYRSCSKYPTFLIKKQEAGTLGKSKSFQNVQGKEPNKSAIHKSINA
jgi:hypothetical protein